MSAATRGRQASRRILATIQFRTIQPCVRTCLDLCVRLAARRSRHASTGRRGSIEAARIHRSARRRGGLAAHHARAAIDAGDRVSRRNIARQGCSCSGAFAQGLKEAGFVEGQNVAIEYRWADGQYDRLPALASDLARRQVAVIFAPASTPAALAAKAATSTIPIVFTVGSDPVAAGLVASLARPGGNVTGVSILINLLSAKRLELLKSLLPGATVIAVLMNPNSANAWPDLMRPRLPREHSGCNSSSCEASTESEIDAAFANLAQQRPAASSYWPMGSFAINLSNSSRWRHATRCQQAIPGRNLPKREA